MDASTPAGSGHCPHRATRAWPPPDIAPIRTPSPGGGEEHEPPAAQAPGEPGANGEPVVDDGGHQHAGRTTRNGSTVPRPPDRRWAQHRGRRDAVDAKVAKTGDPQAMQACSRRNGHGR